MTNLPARDPEWERKLVGEYADYNRRRHNERLLEQRLREAGLDDETLEANEALVADYCALPVQQSGLPIASQEMFHGLPGRLATLLAGYVESDDASLLAQLLTTFGVAVGIRPHIINGATRQGPVTYTGLIGPTARGRKGSGLDIVEKLFGLADPTFPDRVRSGIGSGEALVHQVHDAVLDEEGREVRPAVRDKRLLIRESELAGLLAVVNREFSTLSHRLREAFDGKPLSNEVKRDPAKATVHHIGLIGHCTPEEIRHSLTEQQIRNGLANRITWFLAKRDRKLARSPVFEGQDAEDAASELQQVLKRAQGIHRLDRSAKAWKAWEEWYNALPDDEIGLVAAITARAETLVSRYSVIYALTDASPMIEAEHHFAAVALFEYSRACAEYIWGQTTGDVLADRLLAELQWGPLLQSEITRDVFNGHISAYQLERIGSLLEHGGWITRVGVPPAKGSSGGRPSLQWRRVK